MIGILCFNNGGRRIALSSPIAHIIQGAIYTSVLYPLVGVDAAIVGVSTVLIDVDHVLQYVRDTRSINPLGFFPYYALLRKKVSSRYLSLDPFHTIEFYVGLLIAGAYFTEAYFVLAGCLVHHLSDSISQFREKRLFCRAFSFVELIYRYRSGKYVSTLRVALSESDLTDSILKRHMGWLKKWGMVKG